jgi:hypothetical protein
MAYEVEYTDEFREWWDGLSADEQNKIAKTILLLEEAGPQLGDPHCSAIHGSRHPHMRELRIKYHGRPYRILYAFDPRRIAILQIGGDKTGDRRWYPRFIPIADNLYDEHLLEIARESEEWRESSAI